METEELLAKMEAMEAEIKTLKGGGNDKPSGDDDITAKIIAGVTEVLSTKANQESEKVYDTLFEDRLNDVTTEIPAFGDYLESEDHYGDKVGDKLKGIKDYKKRMATLDKVVKSYVRAQSNDSGASDMRMNAEDKKKFEAHEQERDKVKDQYLKGEISPAEFGKQFFGKVEKQLKEVK